MPFQTIPLLRNTIKLIVWRKFLSGQLQMYVLIRIKNSSYQLYKKTKKDKKGEVAHMNDIKAKAILQAQLIYYTLCILDYRARG